MSATKLQRQIHSTFSTGDEVWSGFKNQIQNMYSSGLPLHISHHLIREYNNKINALSQSSGLFIKKYNAGFSLVDSPAINLYGRSTHPYTTVNGVPLTGIDMAGQTSPFFFIRRISPSFGVFVPYATTSGAFGYVTNLMASTGLINVSGLQNDSGIFFLQWDGIAPTGWIDFDVTST